MKMIKEEIEAVLNKPINPLLKAYVKTLSDSEIREVAKAFLNKYLRFQRQRAFKNDFDSEYKIITKYLSDALHNIPLYIDEPELRNVVLRLFHCLAALELEVLE